MHRTSGPRPPCITRKPQIVRVGDVHGETKIACGVLDIRETMAAYIGMKQHMDVVTHHTT